MRYESLYQWALIVFALLVVFAIGFFVYNEVFPEYKIYQLAYKKLENFRSSVTQEPPAPFSTGIKQIVIPDPQEGPEIIDRCASCHLATTYPHFSPTKIALDINDKPIIDENGLPVLEENPEYVFKQLNEAIEAATDPKRKKELMSLKTVEVEGKTIELDRVLQMHPLIGAETTPFEFHPLEEYGCTSCHSGNGRALVAKRAHGPVFDGEYEPKFSTAKPQFLEKDRENDPLFASMYNDEPGHELIFQTTPILAGPLVTARCVQCHQSTEEGAQNALNGVNFFSKPIDTTVKALEKGILQDKDALIVLLEMQFAVEKYGVDYTIAWLNQELGNYNYSKDLIDAMEGQIRFLKEVKSKGDVEEAIHNRIERLIGPYEPLLDDLNKGTALTTAIDKFVDKNFRKAEGALFDKVRSYDLKKGALDQYNWSKESLSETSANPKVLSDMQTSVDTLIYNYERGKELFVSQACYACHRIEGFSRSSVGPELTMAGYNYPWFIKESIVWPQADLPSSTMPNFKLDHEELGDLMTFLLAQRGSSQAVSEVNQTIEQREWEQGKKVSFEKPITPVQIDDIRYAMQVYVTEGCASCHKLEGFESNVGFANKDNLLEEQRWFTNLFPENIAGSQIAINVNKHAKEIDQRIVDGVRQNSIIEEIEEKNPGLVSGFYSNFKYASRAMNTLLKEDQEGLKEYQARLRRVLMVYIQEYGVGRDIAPHLNYSGIYRDEAWLLGHFHNPAAYTAKSIMPAMPFDDTKFYALNRMLRLLGEKNRNDLKEIWTEEGFDPALAFQRLCSSCHGVNRQGNGIISEWIYPIPKNLRNPVFLRNLTKERAIYSIMHGVDGTPMPPWGEAALGVKGGAVLSRTEVSQLVDWLYQGVPSSSQETEDYMKWSYSPSDVVEEMQKENRWLPPPPTEDKDLVQYYFKETKDPIPGPDKYLYSIKEVFYTEQNLKEGEAFFNINCASCHGKEGTGSSLRAAAMVEAKPRMLTNLPWIRSRDDLRLLRSIKFGVPGTSMTPWGDATTAEQRMQLVMYIRKLTAERRVLDELEEVLYDTFNTAELVVLEGRIVEYKVLEKLEKERENLLKKRNAFLATGSMDEKQITALYSEDVKKTVEIEKRKEVDKRYQQVIDKLKELRKIYKGVGEALIGKEVLGKLVSKYFKFVENTPLVFELVDQKLQISFSKEKEAKRETIFEFIIEELDHQIAELTEKIENAKRKSALPLLEELLQERGGLINLKTSFIQEVAQARKIEKNTLRASHDL